MNKQKIMISIPAYNEEKTIAKVIHEIKLIMSETNYEFIIHVLDDGSIDKTVETAIKAGAIVHSNKRNRGLAFTFKEEMRYFLKSSADVFVHTDADGQYKAKYIPELIEKLNTGYDLILGSRFKGEIEHMPLPKKLGNIAFAKVFTKLTKVNLTDTTTGFRCFNRTVAQEIKYINTFTYTQEQILKSARYGFKIVEIPISSRKTRDSRLFNSSFQYAIRAWINILRIYRDYDPLKFFGSIGLSLIIISLGVFLYDSIVLIIKGFSYIDNLIPSLLLISLIFLSSRS